MKNEAHDRCQDQEDYQLEGDEGIPYVALSEVGEPLRILCIGLVLEDSLTDPPEKRLGGQGHGDSRHTESCDEEAIESPCCRTDCKTDEDDRPRLSTGCGGITHGKRAEGDDRGYRDIDVSRHDDEDHGQGHHSLLHEGEGRVHQVEVVEEIGRQVREEDELEDDQQRQQDLPFREQDDQALLQGVLVDQPCGVDQSRLFVLIIFHAPCLPLSSSCALLFSLIVFTSIAARTMAPWMNI